MNYLLDRKPKKKKLSYYVFFAIFIIIILYFRAPIFSGLSYVSSAIFRPVLSVGGNIGGKLSGLGDFFSFRSTLIKENEELRNQVAELNAEMSNYSTVQGDNVRLQEILDRKREDVSLVLAAILAKPNTSIYDTLIIDMGANSGVGVGDTVFAIGDVPIGRIAEASPSSSKVVLFSSPEEKTEVVISSADSLVGEDGGNVFAQIVGRGGGNFEMEMPRDFILQKGATVSLPGIVPYVVATVETIISDPRDSFQKALLVSPVNIFELKFVQVEK